MNKVLLVGRIVAKPISHTSSKNSIFATFKIAVNDYYNKNKVSYFFPCVVFSKQAEYVLKYINQGDLVSLDGKLTQRNYTTKDGKNAIAFNINVDNIQTLAHSAKSNLTTHQINLENPIGQTEEIKFEENDLEDTIDLSELDK